MEQLNKNYQTYCKIKRGGLYISAAAVMITMFYITIDVFVRTFTSTALVGTYEIIQNYFMPLIIFPGLAYAYSSGVMPKIVIAADRLSKEKRNTLYIVVLIINIILFAALAYFTLMHAIQSTGDKTGFIVGTKELPVWQAFYLPVIAFIMLTIEDVFIVIKNIKTKQGFISFY